MVGWKRCVFSQWKAFLDLSVRPSSSQASSPGFVVCAALLSFQGGFFACTFQAFYRVSRFLRAKR